MNPYIGAQIGARHFAAGHTMNFFCKIDRDPAELFCLVNRGLGNPARFGERLFAAFYLDRPHDGGAHRFFHMTIDKHLECYGQYQSFQAGDNRKY